MRIEWRNRGILEKRQRRKNPLYRTGLIANNYPTFILILNFY